MGRHSMHAAEAPRKRRQPRGLWRRVLTLAMAAMVALGAGGIATQAGFTDQATSSIKADVGTIAITAGGSKALTLDWGTGKLGPDTYTATIAVKNTGTLPATVKWTKTSTAATGASELAIRHRIGSGSWVSQNMSTVTQPANQTIAAGATVNYTFELTIPPTATTSTGRAHTLSYTIDASAA